MRFKKEDVGLYFAMMLMGAGVGLLIGSIIANRLQARHEEEEAEEEWEENALADEMWEAEQVAKLKHISEQGIVDRTELTEEEQAMAAEAQEIAEEEEYVSAQIDKFNSRLEAVKERPAKPTRLKVTKKPENQSEYSDEELEIFIADNEPNQPLITMLYGGLMTMEDVLGVIEAEEDAQNMEEVDYGKQYRGENIFENPPEFDENDKPVPPPIPLQLEVYGVVNERWTLRANRPDGYDDQLLKEIVYDPDENLFFHMRNGQQLPFEMAAAGGSDVWEAAERYMDAAGTDEIIVDDGMKPRWYIFHRLQSGADEAASELSRES